MSRITRDWNAIYVSKKEVNSIGEYLKAAYDSATRKKKKYAKLPYPVNEVQVSKSGIPGECLHETEGKHMLDELWQGTLDGCNCT